MSKILFFSRGYGFDHARRDVLLADYLSKLSKGDIEIKFASYADGFRVISSKGFPCINTGSPSKDNHDRLVKVGLAIKDEKPDLIVSDEDLLALPLAKIFGIPSVLIANWLPISPEHSIMSYFTDPEAIILPDMEGIFTVPPMIKSSLHFTGPILPSVEGFTDRERLRRDLDIPEFWGKLVLVLGRDIREEEIKFLRCCIKAFRILQLDAGMIVVAGELKGKIEQEAKGDDMILIREYIWQLEKYISSSDLVIHRGGYFTLWKLAALGIPSICVPYTSGDFRLQNLARARNFERWGTTVVMEEMEDTKLASEMMDILTSQERWHKMSQAGLEVCKQDGSEKAAEIILSKVKRR